MRPGPTPTGEGMTKGEAASTVTQIEPRKENNISNLPPNWALPHGNAFRNPPGQKRSSMQLYKEKVMQAQQSLKCLVVTLVALTLSMVAQAQVHQQVPEDILPPVYAAFDRGFMPHTEEWAVVIFYRTPACVPADFNLLDFFDPPPRPFLCDLQIEGHLNWRSLDDPYPADNLVRGTAQFPYGLCAGPSCKQRWRTMS